MDGNYGCNKMQEALSLTFFNVKYNISDNFEKDISAKNLQPSLD